MTVDVGTQTKSLAYATSPSRHDLVDNRLQGARRHGPAKVLGSGQTVCGLQTHTWPKYYDPPFRLVRRERCVPCAIEVLSLVHPDVPAPFTSRQPGPDHRP